MIFRAQALSLLLLATICHAATPAKNAPKASATALSKTTALGKTIDSILADPAVARAHWGISVVTPDGRSIYSLNDGQSFEPASNAKLFTTATAFAVFSLDAHFETNVFARGTLDADGTLHGDIVLAGEGDPSISGRAWPDTGKTVRPNPPLQPLEDLADQIAKSGLVHKVTGNVVGDDSWFVFERYGSGWSWDDLQWDYGAPITALTVNDNVFYLDIMPGEKPGDPIAASWNPPVPYYALENTAVTVAAAPKAELGIDRQPGSKIVRLYGTIPVTSKGVHLGLAIEDPAEFAAMAFRQMLSVRGITIAGTATAQHNLPVSTADFFEESHTALPTPLVLNGPRQLAAFPVPPNERLLATRNSPPLGQDFTVINKHSQNLHTELVLRDLGKAVLNDGSIAAGARVVRQFLTQIGVDPGDFLFYDGSGLSPQDMITPRAATTLLAYAAKQPWGDAFHATLPIAGVDGSLAGRFDHSPVKGKFFAKTGTLSEVNALSGYLITQSGKTVILSILCNDHDPSGQASHKAADAIVEAIYAAE
jgi:D-alanyl-D-alanine carboxypeptidase/D-alanyl-D-alanine-endopeptidase (penicillin-binding protein 4)